MITQALLPNIASNRPKTQATTISFSFLCRPSWVPPNRTGVPEDDGRYFIITYYKADRTVVVREPPKRNSGIIGGNFLSRMKVHRYCRWRGNIFVCTRTRLQPGVESQRAGARGLRQL